MKNVLDLLRFRQEHDKIRRKTTQDREPLTRRHEQSTQGEEDGGAEMRSHRTTTAGSYIGSDSYWIKGEKEVSNLERGQRKFYLERESFFFSSCNVLLCRFT